MFPFSVTAIYSGSTSCPKVEGGKYHASSSKKGGKDNAAGWCQGKGDDDQR